MWVLVPHINGPRALCFRKSDLDFRVEGLEAGHHLWSNLKSLFLITSFCFSSPMVFTMAASTPNTLFENVENVPFSKVFFGEGKY
jgi:hypothetical protein